LSIACGICNMIFGETGSVSVIRIKGEEGPTQWGPFEKVSPSHGTEMYSVFGMLYVLNILRHVQLVETNAFSKVSCIINKYTLDNVQCPS
jgi:hypothetical protein